MTIPRDTRAAALAVFGWTGRDAAWLALVCLHSGVFPREQGPLFVHNLLIYNDLSTYQDPSLLVSCAIHQEQAPSAVLVGPRRVGPRRVVRLVGSPVLPTVDMQLWQSLALIVIVWTSTQMALSSDGLNLAAVVQMVIGLSIPLGMLRFYTAPLPGTSYQAMEVEADPLDPTTEFFLVPVSSSTTTLAAAALWGE